MRPSARRMVTAMGAAAVLALAIGGPAAAVKPVRGCPNVDKVPMTISEFRELSRSLGVPSEIIDSPEWLAAASSFDKNGDTILCIGDKPDTPGHLDTWVWNATDNTSNH